MTAELKNLLRGTAAMATCACLVLASLRCPADVCGLSLRTSPGRSRPDTGPFLPALAARDPPPSAMPSAPPIIAPVPAPEVPGLDSRSGLARRWCGIARARREPAPEPDRFHAAVANPSSVPPSPLSPASLPPSLTAGPAADAISLSSPLSPLLPPRAGMLALPARPAPVPPPCCRARLVPTAVRARPWAPSPTASTGPGGGSMRLAEAPSVCSCKIGIERRVRSWMDSVPGARLARHTASCGTAGRLRCSAYSPATCASVSASPTLPSAAAEAGDGCSSGAVNAGAVEGRCRRARSSEGTLSRPRGARGGISRPSSTIRSEPATAPSSVSGRSRSAQSAPSMLASPSLERLLLLRLPPPSLPLAAPYVAMRDRSSARRFHRPSCACAVSYRARQSSASAARPSAASSWARNTVMSFSNRLHRSCCAVTCALASASRRLRWTSDCACSSCSCSMSSLVRLVALSSSSSLLWRSIRFAIPFTCRRSSLRSFLLAIIASLLSFSNDCSTCSRRCSSSSCRVARNVCSNRSLVVTVLCFRACISSACFMLCSCSSVMSATTRSRSCVHSRSTSLAASTSLSSRVIWPCITAVLCSTNDLHVASSS
mmetsp:Transcript_18848/g.60079  ORF Transcript_18848/g.60079 Transcript_18848/m.60079 type:complete len:602 (-) Transcript_18848:288-2093(-)